MGRKRCVAVGCPVNSATHPDESLIRFPADLERFQLWSRVARFDNDNHWANIYLCHRHFRDVDFYDRNTRKKLVHRSNPCYPTGRLNPLTRDYKPDERVLTSPQHQQSLPNLSHQPSSSSSLVNDEDLNLLGGASLHGPGIEDVEIGGSPAVPKAELTRSNGSSASWGNACTPLMASQELFDQGIAPLEAITSEVEVVSCDSEVMIPGPLGTHILSSGTEDPVNSTVPPVATSPSQNAPSSSVASRVATQASTFVQKIAMVQNR